MDVLSRHCPATSGPDLGVTEHATHSFSEFLDSQGTAPTTRAAKLIRRRWHQRPLAIAGLAVMILAAGGVAIAVLGEPDGVVYVKPATQIMGTDGLTLVVQDSNIGPCLEVRTEQGGMAGGCGTDFDDPLSVGVGLIDGKSFLSGWAPTGTVEVSMTFPDGETLSVTALQEVEGYEVMFFLASPAPSLGNEPYLPIEAIAYDGDGNTLATVTYVTVNN
jgi:hypothetical protein